MTEQQSSTTGVIDAPPGQVPPEGIASGSHWDSGPTAGAVAGAAATPPDQKVLVYGAGAAVLGILAGLAFAIVALRPAGRGSPYDLGSAVSPADGLTGHLVLSWNQKFQYNLMVTPSDPAQRDGFSLAASHAPRPLSVDFQLKDSAGSVLCGKTVLLKFDPRQTGSSDGGGDAREQAVRALDIAQAEAKEIGREQGQDVFQTNYGNDGEADSISVQGEMPCPRQAYDRTAAWSFSPNFLSLAEQAALSDPDSGSDEANNSDADRLANKSTRRARKKKAQAPLEAFAIEGDDELVGFDASKGIVETRLRKFFLADKLAASANSAGWQDVPASVHYKCDLNAVCSLRRSGAGVLYARLRK